MSPLRPFEERFQLALAIANDLQLVLDVTRLDPRFATEIEYALHCHRTLRLEPLEDPWAARREAARAAHGLDVAAGRAIDPEAEREIDDWRRLVLQQSTIFGLLPEGDEESPDAITVRAEERRLYALFNLPEGWIPRHLVERASQPTELVSRPPGR